MVTTSQLRTQWAPACSGPWATMSLYGTGRVSVRASIIEAVNALNACLKAANYKTRKIDTGAYNCRKITGGTGYSLHAYGIAIDINWQSNPYGSTLKTDMPKSMITAIKGIRTKSGKQVWRWGGDYSGNKDAMHFEVICSPADLTKGIDPKTVPGWIVKPPVDVIAQRGDTGKHVAFIQSLLNILKLQRINSLGKPSGFSITVDGKFDGQTEEAVREIQRFGRAMQTLSGKTPTMAVNGIVNAATADLLAFWVPRVQK